MVDLNYICVNYLAGKSVFLNNQKHFLCFRVTVIRIEADGCKDHLDLVQPSNSSSEFPHQNIVSTTENDDLKQNESASNAEKQYMVPRTEIQLEGQNNPKQSSDIHHQEDSQQQSILGVPFYSHYSLFYLSKKVLGNFRRERGREMSSQLFVCRGKDMYCIWFNKHLRRHLPNPFCYFPCRTNYPSTYYVSG